MPDDIKESNLSETAKKVLPELREMYKQMREDYREQLKDLGMAAKDLKSRADDWDNLVALSNKIIKGQATEEEKVDFRLIFTGLKSAIASDPKLTEEARTIRENFARKLESSVLGIG